MKKYLVIFLALALLRQRKLKIYEVAESCGCQDITYFSGIFKKLVGVSPSEYQSTVS